MEEVCFEWMARGVYMQSFCSWSSVKKSTVAAHLPLGGSTEILGLGMAPVHVCMGSIKSLRSLLVQLLCREGAMVGRSGTFCFSQHGSFSGPSGLKNSSFEADGI